MGYISHFLYRFIPPFLVRHLGCFHVLAFVNNGARNKGGRCLCEMVISSLDLKNRALDGQMVAYFSFLELTALTCHALVWLWHLPVLSEPPLSFCQL